MNRQLPWPDEAWEGLTDGPMIQMCVSTIQAPFDRSTAICSLPLDHEGPHMCVTKEPVWVWK